MQVGCISLTMDGSWGIANGPLMAPAAARQKRGVGVISPNLQGGPPGICPAMWLEHPIEIP